MAKQAKFRYNLPKVVAVLNLIGDIFQTRICIELGWEEETLDFYMKHPELISRIDRGKINEILKEHLSNLSKNPPQIPTRKPFPVHLTRSVKSKTNHKPIYHGTEPT
ncbi:hypothetical protein [Chitinophaga sp.]|uniref:hypothetical protein n=1 Tax=Chitinophaga sp. TaxID=1869181 RepID=UPI00262DC490|nr:hypothetical protein [uncultured Chitinophaga sp.]